MWHEKVPCRILLSGGEEYFAGGEEQEGRFMHVVVRLTASHFSHSLKTKKNPEFDSTSGTTYDILPFLHQLRKWRKEASGTFPLMHEKLTTCLIFPFFTLKHDWWECVWWYLCRVWCASLTTVDVCVCHLKYFILNSGQVPFYFLHHHVIFIM